MIGQLMRSRSLVVDLDGTLIRSDVLIETGFAYLKSAPLWLCRPLMWLARGGQPALKGGLAGSANVDVTVLPYDPPVLDWLKEEHEAGCALVPATASHEYYAHAIAGHRGLFDQTFETGGGVNLSAHRKRDQLVAEFGEKNFDHVGNSRDDVAVWQSATRAYIVNPSNGVERVIGSRPPVVNTWTKSLRLRQWLKNLLVFVPLLAAHRLAYRGLILVTIIASSRSDSARRACTCSMTCLTSKTTGIIRLTCPPAARLDRPDVGHRASWPDA